MTFRQDNAQRELGAKTKTNWRKHHKRLPGYGQALMEIRRAGMVPPRMVQVVFSFNVARAWPRLVIADDTPASELDFSPLSGLSVQISFYGRDASRVDAVVQAILAARPSFLCTFNIDLAGSDVPARTIIHSLEGAEQAREAA